MILSNALQQIDVMFFNIKILQSYELSAVYIHSHVCGKISVSGKWKKPNFWSRKIKKEKSIQGKLYVWTCAKIIKQVTVSCRVQNIINFSMCPQFYLNGPVQFSSFTCSSFITQTSLIAFLVHFLTK